MLFKTTVFYKWTPCAWCGRVQLGLLNEEELSACVAQEFNPVRIGFHGGVDVWTRDVLNIGVSPVVLIEKLCAKFESLGGQVFEQPALVFMEFRNADTADCLHTSHRSHRNPTNPRCEYSKTYLAVGLAGVQVYQDGAELMLDRANDGPGTNTLTARLVLDCMGHSSPIVRQLRCGESHSCPRCD
eukprot:355955-Chlamydomonas_euryale.AAC.6